MKRIVVFALVLNAALLGVIAHQLIALAGDDGPLSTRQNGDVNGDESLDIGDAIYLLQYIFRGGPGPVALADSPELLARVDELEDANARDSELLVELQEQIDLLRSDVVALVAAQAINTDDIADLSANPAGGLSDEQFEMLAHMSIEQLAVDGDGNTAKAIRFIGVNVQVVNGTDSTDGDGNGLGNLIVGYQELRSFDNRPGGDNTNDRSGSHNLVVGNGHNYSTWGGQVVGERNTIAGAYSTVSGGTNNRALGQFSAVSGGSYNLALGNRSTVSGGEHNWARGTWSTVSGGENNTVTAMHGYWR
jgi:hypothetical protein